MSRHWICITLFVGILLLNVNLVSAQTESSGTGRFDVGGQFTIRKLNVASTEDQNHCGFISIAFQTCVPNYAPSTLHYTSMGFGGRLGYALSKRITLDGALNYFPSETYLDRLPKGFQGLAGVKSGWQGSKLGLFGKARPGIFLYNDRFRSSQQCAGKTEFVSPCYVTQFQLDLGGVIEFYPNRVLVPRIDVSDIMTRIGRDRSGVGPFTQHGLQVGLGIGVRF